MLWPMCYVAELMSQKPDPLNPDDEQRLFEILSMGKDGHDELQYVRHFMKYIVSLENGCYNANTRTDQGTPGDDASSGEGTPGAGS